MSKRFVAVQATLFCLFRLLPACAGDAAINPTAVVEPQPEATATMALASPTPTATTERIPVPTVAATSVSTSTATAISVPSPTATDVIQPTPEPPSIVISQLQLHDIDGGLLNYLSVDAHPYFDGYTLIHGTITIEGDGQLASVMLEVIESDTVVATGEPTEGARVVATAGLTETAQAALIGPFGDEHRRELTQSQLLFRLPAAGFDAIDKQHNGYLTLRISATTDDGQVATRDYRPVATGQLFFFADGEVVTRSHMLNVVWKLVFYDGGNRYRTGDLDAQRGGNDWVQPGVRTIVSSWPNVTIGDFSDMNGGPFPPHVTHQKGLDVDVWFPGYENHDAYAAETLLGLIDNKDYTPLVDVVVVAYRQEQGDPFWEAIKDVRLSDGRLASQVFYPELDHTGHFHVRFHAWVDQ